MRENVWHIVLKKGVESFHERGYAPPALCNGAVDNRLWRRIHNTIHPVAEICCGNVLNVVDGVLSSSMKHQAP